MADKKYTKEEFDKEMAGRCRRLIAEGRMPSKSQFLRSMLKARREFGPKIRRAHRKARENEAQLKLDLVN